MQKIKKLLVITLSLLLVSPNIQAEINKRQISFIGEKDSEKQLYLINEDGSGLTNISNPDFDYNEIAQGLNWSPDGEKLAFEKKENGFFNLYIMDFKSKKVSSIVLEAKYDIVAEWSPDSSLLAFSAAKGEEKSKIFLVKPDGSGLKLLYNTPSYQYDVKWSPDGKRIAFLSNIVPTTKIIITDKDGKNTLTLGPEGMAPKWSPNGKQITYFSRQDGDFDIYLADIKGKIIKKLTNNKSYDGDPFWSPDGKKIVFSTDRNNNKNSRGIIMTEIFVMNTDGSKPVNISPGIQEPYLPHWSPDGKKISYSSMNQFFQTHLYLAQPDGNKLSKPLPAVSSEWSPNGDKLVFNTILNEKSVIFTVKSDSSGIKKIYDNGSFPTWRPRK